MNFSWPWRRVLTIAAVAVTACGVAYAARWQAHPKHAVIRVVSADSAPRHPMVRRLSDSPPAVATAAARKKKRKAKPKPAVFNRGTSSSPIAVSLDGRFVWSVNPGADTVSAIRTGDNRVLASVPVADEPQAVALDPIGRYVFVASAAANTVTVIATTNRAGRFRPRPVKKFVTGAEPWNLVVSPDGRRLFVANSSQDTITVIDAQTLRRIGDVALPGSVCNQPDTNRHFQPRGLAVNRENTRLYVTAFLAFTRQGVGRQADDIGREGVLCRFNINTASPRINGYQPAKRITLGPQPTGFNIDSTNDGVPDPTQAFPNQMQSIVIRGSRAYMPNIAASPSGPLRFNVDTQAFVNSIGGVRGGNDNDPGPAGLINLHLGARDPEPGKKKLFFANPWAIDFTTRSGNGAAYVVSAASDLLVKLNVNATGQLSNTVDADTTRYIDLDDPNNPKTAGNNAGRNPQGIAITPDGKRAYVQNFVSHNVSVVDLTTDQVAGAIPTAPNAAPGSAEEVVNIGAEIFFSSRGHFDGGRSERLSSEGWQSCSSCHFKGLTDGIIWSFNTGPRKSIPLNSTFNPADRNQQRLLNYSAIFDEVQDFEANIRNVSGPGPLAAPVDCQSPPPAQSTLDPAHGLLIGDNGDPNVPPCALNTFAKPNAGRPQITVTRPGSRPVAALDALNEWVRVAVRTPQGPLPANVVPGGVDPNLVNQGRQLFNSAGCAACHGGADWTRSLKSFTPPPDPATIATETNPAPPAGVNPVGAQYLFGALRDVGTFNKGVPGAGNDIGTNIGPPEKTTQTVSLVNGNLTSAPGQDALGKDHNNDGKGNGYNIPSILGMWNLPPYLHNGACETLLCVVSDQKHRTANGTIPDGLPTLQQQQLVTLFLATIDGRTQPFP